MKHLLLTLTSLLVALLVPLNAKEAVGAQFVLVEAEGFAQRGGWVVDPQFKDIIGAPGKNNLDPYWSGTFAPVKTAKQRLCITKPHVGTARIWEVEFYGPVFASPSHGATKGTTP